jgi:hypothetical protein
VGGFGLGLTDRSIGGGSGGDGGYRGSSSVSPPPEFDVPIWTSGLPRPGTAAAREQVGPRGGMTPVGHNLGRSVMVPDTV